MMKKMMLFLGLAVGFVAGSKAGREPYERLESTFRQISGRPEVQEAVQAASDTVDAVTDLAVSAARDTVTAASNKVTDVTEKVESKVKSVPSKAG
jgi:hypothetical protein